MHKVLYPINLPLSHKLLEILGFGFSFNFGLNSTIPVISFILIINGIVSTFLILNQNETAKDSTSNQSSNSSGNPLENLTWICLGFEFILLLINTKVTDF
jgi:hypothetical protein